jgi:glyoxylase I family protein
MNIEHVALNVADPVALAEWYTRHLGMRVLRSLDAAPHTRFLADESGRVVIEVYRQQVPVPDYATMDPMVLHIAFSAPDVQAARQRLLAAGATPAGDVATAPNGDELAMVRDPWGITVQLVKRSRPLLGGERT